jgi:hypothetical protein
MLLSAIDTVMVTRWKVRLGATSVGGQTEPPWQFRAGSSHRELIDLPAQTKALKRLLCVLRRSRLENLDWLFAAFGLSAHRFGTLAARRRGRVKKTQRRPIVAATLDVFLGYAERISESFGADDQVRPRQ